MLLELIREATGDSEVTLRSNRDYIGVAGHGQPSNLITMYPRKRYLGMSVRITQSYGLSAQLDGQGFDRVVYDSKIKSYWLRLTNEDFVERREMLLGLIQRAVSVTSESGALVSDSLPEGNQGGPNSS
jgi:hypothetical protein